MTVQLHISFMLALGKMPQAASESQLLPSHMQDVWCWGEGGHQQSRDKVKGRVARWNIAR